MIKFQCIPLKGKNISHVFLDGRYRGNWSPTSAKIKPKLNCKKGTFKTQNCSGGVASGDAIF